MNVILTKEELRAHLAELRGSVGFVPTMGALHEGHLSLVRAAREDNDYVVVSIFVNPTQFEPGKDFDTYPRTLESDCELLKALGVDVVFAPKISEMYDTPRPLSSRTKITPSAVAELWEGEVRRNHFEGVCLVVSKLFNLVRPTNAYFGEKDFQQLAVISDMVRDLDMDVAIIGRPIVREESGLALSSRNSRFSAVQRLKAAAIFEALSEAVAFNKEGECNAEKLVAGVVDYLTDIFGSDIKIGYVAIVDSHTLQPVSIVDSRSRLLVSVELFGVHLIDNLAFR